MYYQPSEGYAITLRLKLSNKPGILGQVTSAIGLAILIVLFRNRQTINVDDLDTLKG